MADFLKADIEKLIDGVLPWPAVQDMIRNFPSTGKPMQLLQSVISYISSSVKHKIEHILREEMEALVILKPRPIKDLELLKKVRGQNCLICKRRPPNDPHHLSSRGAGNGEWVIRNSIKVINLVCLCREHHTEIETIGRITFADKYDVFVKFCQENLREDLLD